MGAKLTGKEFIIRLDRGAPWDSLYNRHIKAATATLRQKPVKHVDPMHTAAQHLLLAAPPKRLNLQLFDVGRDESSMFNFHPLQAIEYQAVLVVRAMISCTFTDPASGIFWTDILKRAKIDRLFTAWRGCDGHFRMTGGTRDIQNIYCTFLPGFSDNITNANRNYTLDFLSTNYITGVRIPNNAGRLQIYNDIRATEIVQYMLNTAAALNTAGAIDALQTWVRGVLNENFTTQYF